MACMEHYCIDCEKIDFDNKFWEVCPNCGSTNVSNDFDESPDSFDTNFYEEPLTYEQLEE